MTASDARAPTSHPPMLLATTNRAKIRELRRLLSDLPVTWLTPRDIGDPPEVEETGSTFVENALVKARAYAGWSGLPSLADDGGLEIDALGGEPGVRSRRWIDDRDASDEELIAYTLERMRSVPPGQRGAAMRVAEALVFPSGSAARIPPRSVGAVEASGGGDGPRAGEIVGVGSITGIIAEQAAAGRDAGFPFRSVFFIPELGKYYLDLTPDEHEALNHRRAALRPVRQLLAGR